MKAKRGLYIRVSDEWLERVRVEAGVCGEDVSGYVRGAVEMRMGVGAAIAKAEVQKRSKEVAVEETSSEVEGGGGSKGVHASEATRGLSVLSGETAPVADASVSTPRSEDGVGDRFAEMRAKVEAKRAAESEMRKGLSVTQLQYLKR